MDRWFSPHRWFSFLPRTNNSPENTGWSLYFAIGFALIILVFILASFLFHAVP